jgi:hypothetical protein
LEVGSRAPFIGRGSKRRRRGKVVGWNSVGGRHQSSKAVEFEWRRFLKGKEVRRECADTLKVLGGGWGREEKRGLHREAGEERRCGRPWRRWGRPEVGDDRRKEKEPTGGAGASMSGRERGRGRSWKEVWAERPVRLRAERLRERDGEELGCGMK